MIRSAVRSSNNLLKYADGQNGIVMQADDGDISLQAPDSLPSSSSSSNASSSGSSDSSSCNCKKFSLSRGLVVQGMKHVFDNITKDVLNGMKLFASYQEGLKAVVELLHNPYCRDRIVACCFKDSQFEKLMGEWGAGAYISWRWSSLVNCLKQLVARMGPMQTFWDASKFCSGAVAGLRYG